MLVQTFVTVHLAGEERHVTNVCQSLSCLGFFCLFFLHPGNSSERVILFQVSKKKVSF